MASSSPRVQLGRSASLPRKIRCGASRPRPHPHFGCPGRPGQKRRPTCEPRVVTCEDLRKVGRCSHRFCHPGLDQLRIQDHGGDVVMLLGLRTRNCVRTRWRACRPQACQVLIVGDVNWPSTADRERPRASNQRVRRSVFAWATPPPEAAKAHSRSPYISSLSLRKLAHMLAQRLEGGRLRKNPHQMRAQAADAHCQPGPEPE